MSKDKLAIIGDLRTIYKNLEDSKYTIKLPTGEFTYSVKQFIPYDEKKIIIDSSVDAGIDVDLATVLYRIDKTNINMVKEYLLVKYYTDIPVLDDILETYNLFTATGLLKCVLENILVDELKIIEKGIDDSIEEFYRLQKMTNDIGYRLEGIVEAINGDLSSMVQEVDRLDMTSLKTKSLEDVSKKHKVSK